MIPDHSHYQGINDRFAMAKPAVAWQYGNRLDYTLQKCVDQPIHAEAFAQAWAAELQLQVVKMPRFDFFRVRATGVVAPGDALALQGCNISDMYRFAVPKNYADAVWRQRRAAFHEVSGWAATES